MSESGSGSMGRGDPPPQRAAAEQMCTFFLRLRGLVRDESRRFPPAENLEFAINTLVNFDDPRLEGLAPEDVVVYLAGEDGEPQTDIAPLDQHVPLSIMAFRSFVITTRIPPSTESSDAESDHDNRNSWRVRWLCCCCRRRPRGELFSPLREN